MMMKKNKYISVTGLVVVFAFLLAINVLSALIFKNVRLDLTDKQLYTLSKGTENILIELQEPVTLQLFFSEKFFTELSNMMTYGNRVKDLLAEYEALSKGKIKFTVVDPEPFSELEDQAVKYGLQGVPIDGSGNQAYFGLVGLTAADEPSIISFFQPDKEASLEYEVTRLIYSLSHSKRKVVGLLAGLPMQTMGQEWFMLNQLRQSFDLKTIEHETNGSVTKIPENIDVLMLVHPKKLSDETLFAIDQFVLSGGRLIAFVDPFSEEESEADQGLATDRSSDLKKLFNTWGVELAEGKIATDKGTAQQVQMQEGSRIKAVQYVAWMSFDKNQLNTTDFVTRDLEKVSLATPGYFLLKPNAVMDIIPLIKTSSNAMSLDAELFKFAVNPSLLLQNYQSDGEERILALRLSGEVKSAFPDGLANQKNKSQNRLTQSESKINVILVADADMLADKHWVQVQNFFGNRVALPHANNDAFVLNAIENLSGSNDLISLRSRSESTRPFTRVIKLRQQAEQRFQEKERALEHKLKETEKKLAQLQQGNETRSILTSAQAQEIDDFRQEQLQTRKALRHVQHELVKSIEKLGVTLKAINIVLMPLLVIVFAIFFSMMRRRRLASVNG